MDTRDGKITTLAALALLTENERKHFVEMFLQPTAKQLRNGRVGKYDPCPCGSGKKFKWCCYKPASKKGGGA